MRFHSKRGILILRISLIVFCLFSSFQLLSCNYIDPFSAIGTVSVNERFNNRNAYNSFPAPSVTNNGQFNFAVIADTHYYDRQLNYIKNLQDDLAAYNIEFIVILGDITQAGQEHQFDYFLNDRSTSSVPVYTVIGNHDLNNNGFSRYSSKIGRSVYDFSIGDSLFLFLDTANGTLGSGQKVWYEDKLKNNTLNNVFVFSHYSLTDRKAWQTTTTMPYPVEVYHLLSINEQYGVDYFISGHLHGFDKKELRGVQYFIINEADDNRLSVLLVRVNGTDISYSPLSGLF